MQSRGTEKVHKKYRTMHGTIGPRNFFELSEKHYLDKKQRIKLGYYQ
jgi:hypothetical protein